jgi:hypothetical protein
MASKSNVWFNRTTEVICVEIVKDGICGLRCIPSNGEFRCPYYEHDDRMEVSWVCKDSEAVWEKIYDCIFEDAFGPPKMICTQKQPLGVCGHVCNQYGTRYHCQYLDHKGHIPLASYYMEPIPIRDDLPTKRTIADQDGLERLMLKHSRLNF